MSLPTIWYHPETAWVCAKGHLDPDEFIRMAGKHEGIRDTMTPDDFDRERIRHHWYYAVPDGGNEFTMYPAEPHARGAGRYTTYYF